MVELENLVTGHSRSWGNPGFPVTHFFPPGVELEIQGILCAEGKLAIPERQVLIERRWQL